MHPFATFAKPLPMNGRRNERNSHMPMTCPGIFGPVETRENDFQRRKGSHEEEPVCRKTDGHLRESTGPVGAACVRTNVGRPLGAALRIDARRAGRTGAGSDGHPVGAVSALWLPPHPDLSGAARSPDERRPGLAAVASCWVAGAAQATPSTSVGPSPSAAAGDGGATRLGVRLRIRRVRQRPACRSRYCPR